MNAPAPDDTRLLICEGACNPTIDAVDMLIARSRQSDHNADLQQQVRDYQRALHHTPHRYFSRGHWSCTVCAHLRRY